MQTNPEKDTELRLKVNSETARLAWSELDLVEVAVRISHDDKATIGQWMADGKVAKVSDQQALDWQAADAALWAVVVSPFILVQQEKPTRH